VSLWRRDEHLRLGTEKEKRDEEQERCRSVMFMLHCLPQYLWAMFREEWGCLRPGFGKA
jgi:hypothetical protein